MRYRWRLTRTTEAATDITPATEHDHPAVAALLEDSGLPLAGSPEAFATGVVARDDGALVGAAAVELYGDAALLRSVVVASGRRGSGLGRALVQAAEAVAASNGAREVYLLTETAGDWFPRLGYVPIPRDSVPAAVATSVEFTTACADTAIAMRRVVRGVG